MLTTLAATITPGDQSFTFTVPGDKLWTVRSVIAVASRAVGGAPDRAYTLVVNTSTGPVAAVGAPDRGTEPGQCTVTWANAPASAVDAGNLGVVLAPFNPPVLYPGYTITGAIIAAAGADTWLRATVWYDFTLTG